ncbi:MAG TPA: hypothetical protein VL098_14425 [Flavipsychrobacter sp.]|nr:hypothetical protein [Flavipsychrobacter sp.]
MRSFSTAELLTVWERGLDQPLLNRVYLLLGTACGTAEYESMSLLSIGERDARLLQLREWMFGAKMWNIASCPKCSEKVEWESHTYQFKLQPIPPELSVRKFSVQAQGYDVTYRLPDSRDITLLKAGNSLEENETQVLRACIVEAKKNETVVTDLPQSLLEQLASEIAALDPQADIHMQLNCPACSHHWTARFDIMSFLWAEINNWAQRTMQEIYLLAKSFSWSEKDILEMTPRRRQLYLQMIGT